MMLVKRQSFGDFSPDEVLAMAAECRMLEESRDKFVLLHF